MLALNKEDTGMFKGLTKSKKQITIYTLAYYLQTVTANIGVHTSRKFTISFQIIWHNSFAVQGPKLWNAIPYHLNVIQDLEHFKDKLTKFMLSLPDKPPIRGYTPPNTNSLLCWRNERDFTSLWGGQKMWWPRQVLTKLNIGHIGHIGRLLTNLTYPLFVNFAILELTIHCLLTLLVSLIYVIWF